MDKEKNSEPRKVRFFIILVIFYFFVTLIIYVLDYKGFITTSTSVTLFAAIVGPSVPAFLAIYLSRYSEKARVSRKQELLLNISIRKEISQARKKHYEELSIKLERVKKLLVTIKPRKPSSYPENPLLVDEIETDKIKEFIEDASIKNHMEQFKNGVYNFSLQKLVDLSQDASKANQEVMGFENPILSELQSQLKPNSSITSDKTAKNIANKTCIGTDNLIIVLFNIWMELCNSKKTEEEFIKVYFPQRPNLNNLKNETIGNWDIETPNLKFRNQLVLTYTDNLLANYDVLDIVKAIILTPSLLSKFKKLYENGEAINQYITKAKDIIDEIKLEISELRYIEAYNCCPYHEIELSNL
jgi:hypothetical protein